jgi:hypothetical protein
MQEEQRRNKIIGWSLVLAGLVFFVLGGVVSAEIFARQSDPGIERFEGHCVDQARRLGFATSPVGEQVILRADEESPVLYVNKLSVLLGFCPMHQLEAMCAGMECDSEVEGPTFSAVLSLVESTPKRGVLF